MSEEKKEIVVEKDYYFEPKDECDVRLHVGDGENKKTFHCHTLILEIASPVFQDLLSKVKENEEKIKELNFESKNPDHFLIFLNLIYPNDYDLRKIFDEDATPEDNVYYEGDVEYMEGIGSYYDSHIYYPFYLLPLAKEFQVDRVFDEIDCFMACFRKDCRSESRACLQNLIFCDQYPERLPNTYAKCLHVFKKYKYGFSDGKKLQYLNGRTVAEFLKEKHAYLLEGMRGEIRKNDNRNEGDYKVLSNKTYRMFRNIQLDD